MVKSPPPNAGERALIPGQGTKIPSATGQLSLGAADCTVHVPQPTPSAAK